MFCGLSCTVISYLPIDGEDAEETVSRLNRQNKSLKTENKQGKADDKSKQMEVSDESSSDSGSDSSDSGLYTPPCQKRYTTWRK